LRRLALALLLAACTTSPAVDAGIDADLDTGTDARVVRIDGGHDTGTDGGPRCAPVDGGAITACNGHAELCDRRFDEVAYATTHNAMSSAEMGFAGPNQHFALWRQMEDGVRGLMLDVHAARDGTVSLCHADCALGGFPLVDGLADIRAFLDCHPGEVMTIIFESYVPESDIAAAFATSDLIRYVHAQDASAPWPTLREMIASDERMVVFTADHARTLPWHMYSYDYAWENPYSAATPSDLSCAQDRGSRARSLWIFNHFLTNPIASAPLAEMINHDPFFQMRVDGCRTDASGDLPNFVTVDFYDIGDVLNVVDALNGV
jgi:hypothetical protein